MRDIDSGGSGGEYTVQTGFWLDKRRRALDCKHLLRQAHRTGMPQPAH
jgi:hypothetical protein